MEKLTRKQRKQLEYLKLRKQRSTWIMIVCCCIMATTVYFGWTPGLAAFSSSLPENSQQGISTAPQAATQPVMPQGYSANSVVRDPFAVPKEFQPVAVPVTPQPQTNFTGEQSTVSPPPKAPEIPLVLVGVVGGGGQNVAIIKNAGVSRSYQIKDYIGPYQLLSVGESSAILWGPQGRKVLTLER
ncbi:hypothetical protein [Sporomusa sp.]|uniref:hypothetical protein n=1 Tax=Sporomusa sp. TaxID=2078658 RepID=UPI002CC6AEF2|nr:hypothetical protein [Sporomusa sp.]HWR43641.1 hypothetical protein [Sporomusa sp.]